MPETQLTSGPGGRILTNCNVWSPCGEWIVFDTRSDAAGSEFDGTCIKAVHVDTGGVRTLYESRNGACCGVATWHPSDMRVAFILGPECPTAEYSYGISRRQGVEIHFDRPGVVHNLDARDLAPPFTPSALRGGSHVHVWHPHGGLLSFTYDDDVLPHPTQRNVGVAFPRPVSVPPTHPRNHPGELFSVLVTRTVDSPRDGSDDIKRACEEAWVGTRRMLAFQGTVHVGGKDVLEVFVVKLPDNLTRPGDGPLEGTATTRPAPPLGTVQRRLTFGGVGGPRHWLRSSPAGSRIGFLRPDAAGVVQFWTVSPDGGDPVQVTTGRQSVESAFTWHPDGERVACVIGGRVCVMNSANGDVTPLTEPCSSELAPRPEACVFSPDGTRVAFVRRLPHGGKSYNQICVAPVPG